MHSSHYFNKHLLSLKGGDLYQVLFWKAANVNCTWTRVTAVSYSEWETLCQPYFQIYLVWLDTLKEIIFQEWIRRIKRFTRVTWNTYQWSIVSFMDITSFHLHSVLWFAKHLQNHLLTTGVGETDTEGIILTLYIKNWEVNWLHQGHRARK